MVDRRDVEFAIRAKDLSTQDLKSVEAALARITSALEATTKAAKDGSVGVKELAAEEAKLEQIGRALASQQGLVDTLNNVAANLAKTEAAAQEAAQALDQFKAAGVSAAALTAQQTKSLNAANNELAKREQRLAEARQAQEQFNASLKAGEPLTKQQSNEQRQLERRVAAAAERAEEARVKIRDLNTEFAKDAPNRYGTQLQRLESAASKTKTLAEQQRTAYAQAGEAASKAGIDVGNLADAQQRLINAASQVGAGRTTLQAAILSAPADQRAAAEREAAKAALKRSEDEQTAIAVAAAQRRADLLANVGRAGTAAAQKALEDQAKAEEQAFRLAQQRAAKAAEAKIAEAAAATASSRRGIASIAQKALDDEATNAEANLRKAQKAAADATKELQQFRAQADVLERSRRQVELLSFAPTRGETSTSAQSAVLRGASVSGSAGVNAELRNTLGGTEGVAQGLATTIAALEKAKGPVQSFNETFQELGRTISRVTALAKQVDAYRTQQSAVERAEAALRKAAETSKTYEDALRKASAPNKELALSAEVARQATINAGNAAAQQRAKLADLGEGLRQAGVDTRKLGDEEKRLGDIARSVTESLTKLQATAKKRGVAEGDNFGVLGLRPYELQNLSFQVNDFFTQIASGTSVTQAFAQQIGQVIQIGGIGPFLARQIPLIVAFGGALTVAGGVISRVLSQASLLRAATSQQTFGGGFAPETVQRTALAIQRLGLSFAEAREAALKFANLPITGAQYEQLTRAVANYAAATGDAKAAQDLFFDAFNRGVPGILELDDKFGRLSATQRDFIANAQSVEDRARAIAIAIDVYSQAAERARRDATTPLGEALRDLRTAYNTFLDSLASTGAISTATRLLGLLTTAINGLSKGLEDLGPLLPILGVAVGARVGGIPGAVAGGVGGLLATGALGAGGGLPTGGALRDGILRPGVDPNNRFLRRGAVPPSPDPNTGTASPADVDAAFAEQNRRRAEEAAANERARAEAAERRSRAADDEALRLQQIAALEFAISRGTSERATAAERAASAAAAGEKAVRDFLRTQPNANDRTLELVRFTAAQEQANKVAEFERQLAERNGREGRAERRRDLAQIEEDFRAIQQLRTDTVREVQEGITDGSITAVAGMERIRRVAAETQPQLRALADEAKRFAEANAGQDGLSRARAAALVSRTERGAASSGTQGPAGQLLQAEQQRLSQLTQERAQAIQTINALEQQGALTTGEAQSRIRDIYEQTNAAITAQIEAVRTLVEGLAASNDITAPRAAAVRAQLQLVTAQLTFIPPALTAVKQAFEQTFVTSALAGINSIAEAIGGVIANTKTWADVTEAAGSAVLSVFADVLKAIAEAILKQQLLNAIQLVSGALGFGSPTSFIGKIATGAVVKHSGGKVGPGGSSRRIRKVDPAWFANAPRMHNGGVVGANEQATILERGETVLTEDQSDNLFAQARKGQMAGAGGEIGIRNVLVTDPAFMAQALASPEGERIVITHLRKNAATLRQVVK